MLGNGRIGVDHEYVRDVATMFLVCVCTNGSNMLCRGHELLIGCERCSLNCWAKRLCNAAHFKEAKKRIYICAYFRLPFL